MDVNGLRRGLLMQMAQSVGFLDSNFELYQRVHIDTDTKEIVVDAPNDGIFDTGFYLIVFDPWITPQDGINKNDYVAKVGAFLIHGTTLALRTSPAYIYTRTGTTDYWGTAVNYVDSTTKKQIKISVGPSQQVWLLGNHDLLLYRSKGV